MKILPVVVVGTVLFAAALWAQAGAGAPGVPSVAARYQISAAASTGGAEVWMVDTETGDSWRQLGGSWSYAGNPARIPGVKKP